MTYHQRKIRNKERCSYRGPKQRYSVWRAEYNIKWEKCFERMVTRLCKDNNLILGEHWVRDERIPWEHTWDHLWELGYRFNESSRSLRTHFSYGMEIWKKGE